MSDPLGDPHRDAAAPYTLADLCRVTGWSRPTATAAMQAGTAPGYQACAGGKWIIPAQAFRDFCAGTWTPQPRHVVVTTITPIRTRGAA